MLLAIHLNNFVVEENEISTEPIKVWMKLHSVWSSKEDYLKTQWEGNSLHYGLCNNNG